MSNNKKHMLGLKQISFLLHFVLLILIEIELFFCLFLNASHFVESLFFNKNTKSRWTNVVRRVRQKGQQQQTILFFEWMSKYFYLIAVKARKKEFIFILMFSFLYHVLVLFNSSGISFRQYGWARTCFYFILLNLWCSV